MMQRLALSLLVALLLLPCAVVAQTQYDEAPSFGPTDPAEESLRGNDPPADLVRQLPPPAPVDAGYKKPERREIPTGGAVPGLLSAPPLGGSRSAPAAATAAVPGGGVPAPDAVAGGADAAGRFMRAWPDGAVDLSRLSGAVELRAHAERLLAEDEYAKALRTLERLDALRPDDGWTLFQMGRSASVIGDHARAAMLLARARRAGFDAEAAGGELLWNRLMAYVRAAEERAHERARAMLLEELRAGMTVPRAAEIVPGETAAAELAQIAGTAETDLAAPADAKPAPVVATPEEEPPAHYAFPLDRAELERSIRADMVHHIPERQTARTADRFTAAYRLRDGGDLSAAAAALDDLLARIPDHFEALLLRGDLLRAAGDTDGARKEYLNGIFVRPLDPRPVLALARLALDSTDFPAARALARGLLAVRPDHREAADLAKEIAAAETAHRAALAAAQEEARLAAARRPAAPGEPARPHGFVHDTSLEPLDGGLVRFRVGVHLRRANEEGAEPVVFAAEGATGRVLARVGRFVHVEITE